MTIKNGDTLGIDWPEDPENPSEGVQFDAVVMNPPYSAKNWNRAELKVSDPRFEIAGALPPDSKGDYAFLLHGLYHLGINGTMAIVLPHGVLFRGSSEGEIRKKLIDKNQIDAVIGLPSNLFTNTGIPVVVLILKKNRSIKDPVLMIDASNNYIKVGKQNVLQEKDIARIVDVYISKDEIAGFSHKASLKEIIQNDYNMNIPRYVEAIDNEIAHDVDAHLYGGIPEVNVRELKILHDLVPDVLASSLEEVRPGYLKLGKTIEAIKKEVFNHDSVVSLTKELELKCNEYITKFWKELRALTSQVSIRNLEERMLLEIKQLLSEFDDIDVYKGYQIIAEIWKAHLHHDTELIANEGFYKLGRMRKANIVTKGTGRKKREEQDGWNGVLVPNTLIAKFLYTDELKALENKRNQIQEIYMEVTELVEAAKVEDSEENEALFNVIKRTKDDELGDAFDKSALKTELKGETKETAKYELLKKVENLMTKSTALSRAVKVDEKELNAAVEERILVLTDDEIDTIVYYKWFGTTIGEFNGLIQSELKNELSTLELLNARYSDTLSDLDKEIESLLSDFNTLMNDLVVG